MTTESTETETGEFPCTYGCGRRFDTAQKRNMHQIRMHTHKAQADQAWKGRRPIGLGRGTRHPDQSREARLARKREYNTFYRARLKRLKAKGMTLPTTGSPSTSTEYKRSYYHKQKARFAAMGLNAHGQPFKVGGRARRNIQIAQAARRRREAEEKRLGKFRIGNVTKRKPLRYVYPLPQDDAAIAPQTATADEMEPGKEWVHAQLHHCPNCGENLTKWKKNTL